MKQKIGLVFLVIMTLVCASDFVYSQETVEGWQKKAVADFPDLAVKDSLMNYKFVEMVKVLKTSNPSFFNDVKWPYTLAAQIAGVKPAPASIIPGLDEDKPAGNDVRTDTEVNGVLDAGKLSLDYKSDRKAAGIRYDGKRLNVSGEIIRVLPAANTAENAAFLYLKTGPGLPVVRVELSRIKAYASASKSSSNQAISYLFRVENESILEVREVKRHIRFSHRYIDQVMNSEWAPIVSKGNIVKLQGTCSGVSSDVVLTNAELQIENYPFL